MGWRGAVCLAHVVCSPRLAGAGREACAPQRGPFVFMEDLLKLREEYFSFLAHSWEKSPAPEERIMWLPPSVRGAGVDAQVSSPAAAARPDPSVPPQPC